MPQKHKDTKSHKKEFDPIPHDIEEIGKKIVHAAYLVHKALGPDSWKKYMKSVFAMNYGKWDYRC